MHNLYPTQYHCAAYDFVRRAGAADRPLPALGLHGRARCAQVVWSGDPTVGLGLRRARLAGQGGPVDRDVGDQHVGLGHRRVLRDRPARSSATSCSRAGCSSAPCRRVMRMQRNGVAFPEKDRPQVEDDDQIANWRRYAKLHTQLLPYLEAADRVYRRDRPADHAAPGARLPERRALAPARGRVPVRPGPAGRAGRRARRDRARALPPPGHWVDFWRAVSYREKRGDLRLAPRARHRGRHEETVPAPLDELPLMVRAGAVLPLLPADVDTLAVVRAGADAVPALAPARAARPDRVPARALEGHVLPRREAALGRARAALGPHDPREAQCAVTRCRPRCRSRPWRRPHEVGGRAATPGPRSLTSACGPDPPARGTAPAAATTSSGENVSQAAGSPPSSPFANQRALLGGAVGEAVGVDAARARAAAGRRRPPRPRRAPPRCRPSRGRRPARTEWLQTPA